MYAPSPALLPTLVLLLSLLANPASAEKLTTATLDVLNGETYECTAVNAGPAAETATISILAAADGALLAGGASVAIPPTLAASVTLPVGFLTPKQAYCEIEPENDAAPLRTSFKRIDGVGRLLEDSDAIPATPAVTLAAQYVPYFLLVSNGGLCDEAGGAPSGSRRLFLRSDAPFTVESIRVGVFGADAASDELRILGIDVDNLGFTGASGDLIEAPGGPFGALQFDVLGGGLAASAERRNGPRFLASNASPTLPDDVSVEFGCSAGATEDLTIGDVHVQGWRRSDAPVTGGFDPS